MDSVEFSALLSSTVPGVAAFSRHWDGNGSRNTLLLPNAALGVQDTSGTAPAHVDGTLAQLNIDGTFFIEAWSGIEEMEAAVSNTIILFDNAGTGPFTIPSIIEGVQLDNNLGAVLGDNLRHITLPPPTTAPFWTSTVAAFSRVSTVRALSAGDVLRVTHFFDWGDLGYIGDLAVWQVVFGLRVTLLPFSAPTPPPGAVSPASPPVSGAHRLAK